MTTSPLPATTQTAGTSGRELPVAYRGSRPFCGGLTTAALPSNRGTHRRRPEALRHNRSAPPCAPDTPCAPRGPKRMQAIPAQGRSLRAVRACPDPIHRAFVSQGATTGATS